MKKEEDPGRYNLQKKKKGGLGTPVEKKTFRHTKNWRRKPKHWQARPLQQMRPFGIQIKAWNNETKTPAGKG